MRASLLFLIRAFVAISHACIRGYKRKSGPKAAFQYAMQVD
jgi:hypothetical protein